MNAFTLSKIDRKCGSAGIGGNMNALIGQRLQMHLNSGLRRVPTSPVAEVSKHKVRAKVAIQTRQNVQIERSSHSGRIVVGGKQHGYRFVGVRATVWREVCPKQKSIARKQLCAEVAQHIFRILRREIPDA